MGTWGQTAGLVGRWLVGQQGYDGQSRGWHPQTAGQGASPRQNRGFPGGEKEREDDQTRHKEGKENLCLWLQPPERAWDMRGQRQGCQTSGSVSNWS